MKKFFIIFSIVLLLFTSCELFLVEIGGYFLISDEEKNLPPPNPPTPPTGGNLTSPTVGTMVKITGGSFARDNDGTGPGTDTTEITVSNFYLGETEVTQAQWVAVMGSNPSFFTTDVNLPVESVSWYEAIAFCNALSVKEGLTPFYTVNGNTVTVSDWKATGYRLPTEAEWEYAAGHGGFQTDGKTPNARTTYSGTDNQADLGDYAWYTDNNGAYGTPTYGSKEVKEKIPNALGLYDMSGNVIEWCWDWFSSSYDASVTNPTGPTSGSSRVFRGGGWGYYAVGCKVDSRIYNSQSYRSDNLGFRVARSY